MLSAKPSIKSKPADFSDFVGILDINRNVYNGNDYFASSFFNMMHDPLHMPYVSLAGDEIVSFSCRYLVNKNTTYSYAARTKSGYEGLGALLSITDKFKENNPGITHYLSLGIGSDRQDAFLERSESATILDKWLVFMAEVPIKTFLTSVYDMQLSSEYPDNSTRLLSYTEALSYVPDISNFLQKNGYMYVFDLLPVLPKEISRANIRQCLSTNSCIITLEPDNSISAMSLFKSSACGRDGDVLHSALMLHTNSVEQSIRHVSVFLSYIRGLAGSHTTVVSPFVHIPHRLSENVSAELCKILGEPIKLNGGRADMTFFKDTYA